MNTSEFGFWAMLAFWGIAIGGIGLGITWARSRRKNPVPRKLIIDSLKKRLEKGEINQDEYDRKISELQAGKDNNQVRGNKEQY